MDFDKLRNLIYEDIEDNGGEIVEETEEGIEYFDYSVSYGENTLFFRKPEYCTKKRLFNIIQVGEGCIRHGITKELMCNIIADAYKDCMDDMMCCLRGIIFFCGEREFAEFVGMFATDEDKENDSCSFEFDDDLVGKTWFAHQLAFVSIGSIIGYIAEKEDTPSNDESFRREILDGAAVTAIHELRHIMLDCNPFLDEEEYPEKLRDEDEVEEFSRYCWTNIHSKY